jgi:Family of unknown function (DUF6878)
MNDATETPSAAPVEDDRARNKAIVFTALAEAGIHRVTIDYDGGGDSGQIEGIEAWDANDQRISFPADTKIKLAPEYPQDPGAEQNLEAAVETLAWHYLEQRHDGWENNDGAFGVFVFDVPASLITLEHNERYTEVNTINDEF